MDEALYHAFFNEEERHWWFAARRTIVLDALTRWAGLKPGDTVLDVGCGTGANLRAMAARYRVVGTDMSPLAVMYARQRGIEDVYLGDLSSVPANRFDVRAVLLLDVVEHVEDDVALLEAARARLPADGRVVVTAPAYMWLWSSHDVANHHKRRYDAALLERRLRAAGLLPVKLTYMNTLLFPLALVRRAIDRLAPSRTPDAMIKAPPALLNALLRRVFEAEVGLLARRDLPFGLSLLAVAAPA